jgi:1-acyl-sn-glycerol-3-phosphate acyltransferase
MINVYHLTKYLFRFCFYSFYRYRIYGCENPYQGAAIIAPNHISFLDPPLISAAWPEDTHFLAKASLFQSAWGAWLFPRLNTHPVQGSEQNLDTFRMICQLLKQGKKVVIFPEGQRSATGKLQALKSGASMLALRMHCPIIPTYIVGTYDAWPRNQRWPRLNARVSCVFGQPIFPHDPAHQTKKAAQEELSLQVQKKIEALRAWYEAGAVGTPP